MNPLDIGALAAEMAYSYVGSDHRDLVACMLLVAKYGVIASLPCHERRVALIASSQYCPLCVLYPGCGDCIFEGRDGRCGQTYIDFLDVLRTGSPETVMQHIFHFIDLFKKSEIRS